MAGALRELNPWVSGAPHELNPFMDGALRELNPWVSGAPSRAESLNGRAPLFVVVLGVC